MTDLKKVEKKTETKPDGGYVLDNIPIGDIIANDDFNARTDYGQVANLKTDIGKNGLINPVCVEQTKNGKYNLIAGFCRFKAIKELGWKTIPASVRPEYPNDMARYNDNLRENLARKDLSSYDVANRMLWLTEKFKITDKELATNFRGSIDYQYKYINNLITARRDLHPDILTMWQERHPLATVNRLFHLKKLAQDEQIKTWESWAGTQGFAPYDSDSACEVLAKKITGRGAKGVVVNDEAERAHENRVQRPSPEIISKVVKMVADGIQGLPVDTQKGIHSALLWTLGATQDLVVSNTLVYSHGAEKEAEELARKEAKEAKKAAKETTKASKELAELQKKYQETQKKLEEVQARLNKK